ncbi:MAG: apolipoprotein N-acyltransferase [Methylovulum sp.]|nr:apolipoprotein N-acyltransferase [Methylovulum sp.]
MHNIGYRLLKPWLLPIMSGIFIGTSYIPFPPWASLFCFVPLWLFWGRQTRLKPVVIGGLVTAFVFTLIGFNWITYTLHEFARLDWPIAFVGMLFYALIANLYVPLAGCLWFWGRHAFNWSERLSLGLMAIITIICEAYSLTLFDWNFGYTWYGSDIPLYHWAEVVGFSGLSAATLLCNLPLYLAWQQRKQHAGKRMLAAVVSGFILLNIGGLWLKARLPQPDASFTTLLVQANIGNAQKMAAELGNGYRNEILRRNTELTDQAIKTHSQTTIDFALWPETAFPGLLGEAFKADEKAVALGQSVRAWHTPLITGAYSADRTSNLITNSLFVFNGQGEMVPPHYSKSILLAFGEYIPGEQVFPVIRKWLPATGHFARGSGPTQLLDLNGYKIGAQICYESLFPGFSRALAQLGAQFIVNVTNDAWYGDWQEPYQHMMMTLARGVEFRRPVVRVTNTGISTVVLASGEILEQSPINQTWAGLYQVPYLKNPPVTFYQRYFWLVPGLLWGALLLLLIIGVKRERHRLQSGNEVSP